MPDEASVGQDDVSSVYAGIFNVLGSRADQDGIDALTADERTVLLVAWAGGVIDNGGFQYFFERATNILEVADAFAAVGLQAIADGCRQSVAAFPGGRPFSDLVEQRTWMEQHDHDPKVIELWDRIGDAVMPCAMDETEIVLATFIRERQVGVPLPRG